VTSGYEKLLRAHLKENEMEIERRKMRRESINE